MVLMIKESKGQSCKLMGRFFSLLQGEKWKELAFIISFQRLMTVEETFLNVILIIISILNK